MSNYHYCAERDLPHTQEPVADLGLTGIELHAGGDFSVGGRRYRQDEDLLAALAPPWMISKLSGAGRPLLLLDVRDGRKRQLHYETEQWLQRLYWLPLSERLLYEVLLFLPEALHVIPTLHQFRAHEPVDLTLGCRAGELCLSRGPEQGALLEIRIQDGPVRCFAARDDVWYEIHTTWLDVRPPAAELALPAMARFVTDLAVAGKSWVPLGDLRCPAELGSFPDFLRLPDLPHIELGPAGMLVVQNCAFPPGGAVELHFLECVVRRHQQLLQLDLGQSRQGESPGWHSRRFRYADGGWHMLLDEIVLDWWARHGGWVILAGGTVVVTLVAIGCLLLLFDLFPFLAWILDAIWP